jgi:hypothetical protein
MMDVPMANLETVETRPRDESLYRVSPERHFEDETSLGLQRCMFCKGNGQDAGSRELR